MLTSAQFHSGEFCSDRDFELRTSTLLLVKVWACTKLYWLFHLSKRMPPKRRAVLYCILEVVTFQVAKSNAIYRTMKELEYAPLMDVSAKLCALPLL